MSTSFELEGKLFKRNNTEQISESFKKREFVVLVEDEKDEKYNQYIKFELLQDNCSKIDGFKQNDTIKVSFNLRGREWNGNFFTNLVAWRIEAVSGDQGQEFTPKKVTNNTAAITDDLNSDMPF